MKVQSITKTGAIGTTELSSELLGGVPRLSVVARAVRVYRSNQRQGTGAAQTRATVSLTKRKVYRQKGTGNARHGAKSAPIFVGGGVTHGPKLNQHWSKTLSTRAKRAALHHALKAQSAVVFVAQSLEKMTGKTKEAVQLLKNVRATHNNILVVSAGDAPQVQQSCSNLPGVRVVTAARINALDVASADALVIAPEAVTVLSQRLGVTEAAPKPTKKTTKK